MSLHVAFCLWGLPEDPAAATAFAASAGFQSVDVRPGYGSLAASDRTLPVTCMAVAHLMPEGAMLDATSEPARQLAVDHVRAGILEAQSLGVPDVYLAPPATSDAPALAAYRETALTLADEANCALASGWASSTSRAAACPPFVRPSTSSQPAATTTSTCFLISGTTRSPGSPSRNRSRPLATASSTSTSTTTTRKATCTSACWKACKMKLGLAMRYMRWSRPPMPARSASKSTWQCPIHGPPPPAACRSCGGSNQSPRPDQLLGMNPRSTAPRSRSPWA